MNCMRPQLYDKPMNFTEIIYSCEELVQYSFIHNTSVTQLDLSLGEFSKFKKKCEKKNNKSSAYFNSTTDEVNAVFTEEAFRKRFASNRNILYNLHLDVSKDLESCLRNEDDKSFRSFYTREVFITNIIILDDFVYNCNFDKMLTLALRKTDEKVKLIHWVCKLCESMPFILENEYIRKNGLKILHSQNADSTVVMDFLTAMNTNGGYIIHLIQEVFEFILDKANQIKYNLWTLSLTDMFIYSVICGDLLKTETLFKYCDAPGFNNGFYDYIKIKVKSYIALKEGSYCPIRNGLMTKKRHFLILQIFYVFDRYGDDGLEVLQMLWKSIPDPFITMCDLTCVFDRRENTQFLENVCQFLEKVTGEEVIKEVTCIPRQLKNYCRVTIRRILNNNFQLPTGIDELRVPSWTARFRLPTGIGEPVLPPEIGKLNLPTKIKKFLKLEHQCIVPNF